ncbi:DNRLRE domain-containing protein [Pontibacter sp. 172403-2]|uniref:DNRLRE domain-containing protein n=1 Tax=Pontibacter rufus TaxID=2791028 RepID=UPI0018AFDB64|nr:DNRLRE domain-containing protein [Pontibacter sp. 172403-2]MBF9253530.1 DNRLRE domain-containing protein [Pontibacter sp. 172403-2]
MALTLLPLICFSSMALGQTKLWDKTLGGSVSDDLSTIVATADEGFLLGGYSNSNKSGDKSQDSKGGDDYWIVKLNADGTKAWDKTIGGNGDDQLTSMQQTSDGGYILGGTSYSDKSGDKSEENKQTGYYSTDYWVVKLNAAGEKEWDKTIGGNSDDQLTFLQQTDDDGYILGGTSFSNKSGDKTQSNNDDCDENGCSSTDYWVVKLNVDGNKEWDKTIGGNNFDHLTSLQQTNDRGYILGGFSFSDKSGDKTENSKGVFDYWIVKLDPDGTKSWDKTIGGDGSDYLQSLQQTSDGGYIAGGDSNSDISGDKTEGSEGIDDFWIVKLSAEGNKEWDKTIGGNYSDQLTSLQQTSDRGFLLGGYFYSDISGTDFWIIKLNPDGIKSWDKAIGGNSNDILQSLLQTSDGSYIAGGYSDSDASGDKTENSKGGPDYWVVKLNNDDNPCSQAVSSFTLLNADTQEELMTLQQGDTVDLTMLPTQHLSIRANTAPAAVGRVNFNLDSTTEAVDTTSLYTFTSKTKFVNGPHTLTATPYCEAENGGGRGTALTLNFQVISNERIVTITADKDNTINSTAPEGNDGASVVFRTGRTGSSGGDRLHRALLHFDLSSIPAGSTIDSAILTLHVIRTGEAVTGVALHRTTTNWSELESTWSHAVYPGTPWTTPGGDFEPNATASTGNVSRNLGFLVIPNLTGDVQEWVNDSSSNFGWVLKIPDEEIPYSAKLIASREQDSEIYRPSLRIIYTLKDENPNPEQPAVQSFTLVNARNEQDLMRLADGDTLDLAALPTRSLNIRANTSQKNGINVKFSLSGQQSRNWKELGYPYALFGDEGGNYHAWSPAPGNYTLTATPYTNAGAKGTPLTISFTIVNKLAVKSFTLVNARNEQDLLPLADGDTVNLAALSTRSLNIRANTSQQKGINVKFVLSGEQSRSWTELGSPYALFGDEAGNYHAWSPAPGNYTLTAIPSSDAGVPGIPLTISFTVANTTTINLSSSIKAVADQVSAVAVAYPNPTHAGKIKVVLPQQVQGDITYTLVSLLGAKVAGGELNLSSPAKEVEFDFSAQMQATGVYFLHLKGQNLQTILRVVRQ